MPTNSPQIFVRDLKLRFTELVQMKKNSWKLEILHSCCRDPIDRVFETLLIECSACKRDSTGLEQSLLWESLSREGTLVRPSHTKFLNTIGLLWYVSHAGAGA